MLTLNEATHEYTEDGRKLISVTDVLALNGLYKGTDYFTPESREFGQAVHLACEYYDRGIFDDYEWDPVVIPCAESWAQFRKETGFVPLAIEEPMSSRIYGFAGKPDVLGTIGDDLWIPDRKTGAQQKCSRYQTAGYHLLMAEHPQFKDWVHKYKRIRRGTITLSKEGKCGTLNEHTDRNDIQQFVCLLIAVQIRQEHGAI